MCIRDRLYTTVSSIFAATWGAEIPYNRPRKSFVGLKRGYRVKLQARKCNRSTSNIKNYLVFFFAAEIYTGERWKEEKKKVMIFCSSKNQPRV